MEWMLWMALIACGGGTGKDTADSASPATSTGSTGAGSTGTGTTGSGTTGGTATGTGTGTGTPTGTTGSGSTGTGGPCGGALSVEIGLEGPSFTPTTDGTPVPITLAHDGEFEVRLAARIVESATAEVRLIPTVRTSDGTVLAGSGGLDPQFLALVMEDACAGTANPLRAFLDDQPLTPEDVCALAGETLSVEVSVLDSEGREAVGTVDLVAQPRVPGGC